VADTLLLDDGTRIDTPQAWIDGSNVMYVADDLVMSIPHIQVVRIIRDTDPPPAPAVEEPQPAPAVEEPPPAPVVEDPPTYRVFLTDGRILEIGVYEDSGDVIRYTKYGVGITIEKNAIQQIRRVTEDGEQAVYRNPERLPAMPVPRSVTDDNSLRRLSEESFRRAQQEGYVAEDAQEILQERKREVTACLGGCLEKMSACRGECNEILEKLKRQLVPTNDPAYIMVKEEVVAPCTRKCIAEEKECRIACGVTPTGQ
jgi:hypothetical protein